MAEPAPVARNQAVPVSLLPRRERVRFASAVAPLTAIVGREREVAAALALLRDPHVRLLTLTGPGGVGKTRLALQVVDEIDEALADEIVVVLLTAIADPGLVGATIVQALGIRDAGSEHLMQRAVSLIGAAKLLLVLDNFEHVLDAAGVVVELLMGCPNLKILVTSRSVLRISGEHGFEVPPLALPESGQSLDRIVANDAVRLFAERAQAVRSQFTLTPENAPAVAAICARLDGLPLAIELAAARSSVLDPRAMLARLEQRLPILTGGLRDAPVRQKTMRGAIAWSYDLLPPEEQIVFRRLAVFAGGFTLEAAEELSRETAPRGYPGKRQEGANSSAFRSPSSVSVLDELDSLVGKSLLRHSESDDEPRFAMLEVVREYGLELLEASGEIEPVRARHAAWCRELVEQSWQNLVDRHEVDRVMRRLEREHGNIRTALTTFKQHDATDAIVDLAGRISWFWLHSGHVREGLDWLLPILERDHQEPTHSLVRAQLGAGALAHYHGDEERSLPLVRAGLAGARALGDRWLTAQGLLILGIDEADEGNFARSLPLFDEAVAIARGAGDRIGLAQAQSHRGLFGWASGETDAEERIAEALAIQRAAGDALGVSHSLSYLGLIAADRGDGARAGPFFEECLTIRLEASAMQYLPWSLENVALLASVTKQPQRAARLFAIGALLRQRIGSPGHEPEKGAYVRATERARTALGEPAFAAAWAAGRAFTVDEAIADAHACFAPAEPAPAQDAGSRRPGVDLTPREMDVLRLLTKGLTDKEIGEALFISWRTAQGHVASILAKLGVSSRSAAAGAAFRSGLVSTSDTPPS